MADKVYELVVHIRAVIDMGAGLDAGLALLKKFDDAGAKTLGPGSATAQGATNLANVEKVLTEAFKTTGAAVDTTKTKASGLADVYRALRSETAAGSDVQKAFKATIGSLDQGTLKALASTRDFGQQMSILGKAFQAGGGDAAAFKSAAESVAGAMAKQKIATDINRASIAAYGRDSVGAFGLVTQAQKQAAEGAGLVVASNKAMSSSQAAAAAVQANFIAGSSLIPALFQKSADAEKDAAKVVSDHAVAQSFLTAATKDSQAIFAAATATQANFIQGASLLPSTFQKAAEGEKLTTDSLGKFASVLTGGTVATATLKDQLSGLTAEQLRGITSAKGYQDIISRAGSALGFSTAATAKLASASSDVAVQQGKSAFGAKLQAAAQDVLTASMKQTNQSLTEQGQRARTIFGEIGSAAVGLTVRFEKLLGLGNSAPINRIATQAERGAQDVIGGLGSVAASAGAVTIGIAALAAASLAGAVAFKALAEAGIEVSKSFDAIVARSPLDSIQKTKDSIFVLSKQTGVAFDELAAGMAQSLLKTGQDVNAASLLLQAATKTSIVGVTSISSAVENIGDIIRSYGLNVTEAGRVSDQLIKLSQRSKEAIDSTSKSVAQLAEPAKALGFGYEQVIGAIQKVVAGGIPAQRAVFGLTGIMAALIQESSPLSERLAQIGFDASKTANGARGIATTLLAMNAALEKSGTSLQKFFPEQRRLPTVLALLQEGSPAAAKALAELKLQADDTGSTLEAVLNQPGRELRILFNDLDVLTKKLGDSMVTALGPSIHSAIQQFDLLGVSIETTASNFSKILVPLQGPLESVSKAIDQVSDSLAKLGIHSVAIAALQGEFELLAHPINAVSEALAGLAITSVQIAHGLGQISDEQAMSQLNEIGAGIAAATQQAETFAEALARLQKQQEEAFRANAAAEAAEKTRAAMEAASEAVSSLQATLKNLAGIGAGALGANLFIFDKAAIRDDLEFLTTAFSKAGSEVAEVFKSRGIDTAVKESTDVIVKQSSSAGEAIAKLAARYKDASNIGDIANRLFETSAEASARQTTITIGIGKIWEQVLFVLGDSVAEIDGKIRQYTADQKELNDESLLQQTLGRQSAAVLDALSKGLHLGADQTRLFKDGLKASVDEYQRLAILARRPIDLSAGTGTIPQTLKSAQELLDEQKLIDDSWHRVRDSVVAFGSAASRALSNAEADIARTRAQADKLETVGLKLPFGPLLTGFFKPASEYMRRFASDFQAYVVGPLKSFSGGFDRAFADFFQKLGSDADRGREGADKLLSTIKEVQDEIGSFNANAESPFEKMAKQAQALRTIIEILPTEIQKLRTQATQAADAEVARGLNDQADAMQRQLDILPGLVKNYEDLFRKTTEGFGPGFTSGINKFVDEARNGFQQGAEAAQKFTSDSVDALTTFLTTLGTGKSGMKAFEIAVVQSLQQIIAKMLALQIISGALGFFGFGGAGAGGGPGIDGISTRAQGGPVNRDEDYLVGEKGPELFRPRQSGTIVPHGQTLVALGGHPRRNDSARNITAASAASHQAAQADARAKDAVSRGLSPFVQRAATAALRFAASIQSGLPQRTPGPRGALHLLPPGRPAPRSTPDRLTTAGRAATQSRTLQTASKIAASIALVLAPTLLQRPASAAPRPTAPPALTRLPSNAAFASGIARTVSRALSGGSSFPAQDKRPPGRRAAQAVPAAVSTPVLGLDRASLSRTFVGQNIPIRAPADTRRDGMVIHVHVDGIHLTSQSLDPRTAGDVVLAQMSKIQAAMAVAIEEGATLALNAAIRRNGR